MVCSLALGTARGNGQLADGRLPCVPGPPVFLKKAVALDPHNREAKNDLFDFYLNAPGFLGGGIEKAEAAAKSIAGERPASRVPEFEEETQIYADRRKDYAASGGHICGAPPWNWRPSEAGRVVDLARYLAAKRGRLKKKAICCSNKPEKWRRANRRIAFCVEASANIENHRSIERARALLESYLHCQPPTLDDPPRQEAEKLLRRAGGSTEVRVRYD